MHEIICPHCKKAFKVDEAGYADILKQVRDSVFEQQLHRAFQHRLLLSARQPLLFAHAGQRKPRLRNRPRFERRHSPRVVPRRNDQRTRIALDLLHLQHQW